MPYLTPERKARLEAGDIPSTPGELNYQITRMVLRYVKSRPMSYSLLNEVVGAMESAKAEFQRRLVAPYEDLKMVVNGDVGYEEFTALQALRGQSTGR